MRWRDVEGYRKELRKRNKTTYHCELTCSAILTKYTEVNSKALGNCCRIWKTTKLELEEKNQPSHRVKLRISHTVNRPTRQNGKNSFKCGFNKSIRLVPSRASARKQESGAKRGKTSIRHQARENEHPATSARKQASGTKREKTSIRH